jgi:hypothetical protein
LNQPKLSVLDWAEKVMRWVELVQLKAAQGAHPLGGFQPHDKGFSRTGRVLGVSRRDVERASVIASICTEAKAEIRRLNLNVQRKLLAIGAEPEDLQLAKLYELTRDRKSEGADQAPEGDDGGQPEGAREPGGFEHEEGERNEAAAADAAATGEKTIILRDSEEAGARQPPADQVPIGSRPEEVGPGEAAPPAMAAEALIESPAITADPDGENSGPVLSPDLGELDLAWERDCARIYDRLSDDLRRHFIRLRLGYLVVARDGVNERHAEPEPGHGDA